MIMKISHWLLPITLLMSINLQANWSNIRNSSYTSDNEIFIRYESTLYTGYDQRISYFSDNAWQDNICENIAGDTFQAVIPFPNIEPLPLSFRIEAETAIYLIPGYSTQQPVSLSQMTTLSEYERDPDIPAHQNIAGEGMLFSEDHLYFTLSNFGGGFPVSEGTFGPFYSYSIALWPAGSPTPEFVYILVYTINLAPYINPGLYKVNALTEEMSQIGTITHQIEQETDTLYLTCSWLDLMGDPDFAGSYTPESGIEVSSIIQKIENFGATITIMDEGNNHHIQLIKKIMEPFTNHLPEISNVNVEYLNELALITVDYYDQDGHFPLTGEIIFDNQQTVEFVTATHDFSGVVSYSCEYPDIWSSGTIRFSDNLTDFVEQAIFSSSDPEMVITPSSSLDIYPNPFIAATGSDRGLTLRIDTGQYADIKIFNLKGQLLYQQENYQLQGLKINLSRNELLNSLRASGIYLLKVTPKNNLRESQETLINRFLFIK